SLIAISASPCDLLAHHTPFMARFRLFLGGSLRGSTSAAGDAAHLLLPPDAIEDGAQRLITLCPGLGARSSATLGGRRRHGARRRRRGGLRELRGPKQWVRRAVRTVRTEA